MATKKKKAVAKKAKPAAKKKKAARRPVKAVKKVALKKAPAPVSRKKAEPKKSARVATAAAVASPSPPPAPPARPVLQKIAPPKPPAADRPTKWTAQASIPDFFPHEMVREESRWLCLACILDVFTRHLGLSAATAHKEIRGHRPSLAELTSETPVRPYFDSPGADGHCPHCHSPAKWHARLALYRVEGGKVTESARRVLHKALPSAQGQYEFLDQKSTGREAFFQWLNHAGSEFDFEDYRALMAATKLYLSRREPNVDWEAEFAGVHVVRRNKLLAEGWQKVEARLELSAMLFDEVLAIQYLLSRSQRSGGITFEGRKTVQELVARLRHSGYLRHINVRASEPGDVLEQLLDHLCGGDASLKFHYILDRRDFLAKFAALKTARVPKLKLGISAGA